MIWKLVFFCTSFLLCYLCFGLPVPVHRHHLDQPHYLPVRAARQVGHQQPVLCPGYFSRFFIDLSYIEHIHYRAVGALSAGWLSVLGIGHHRHTLLVVRVHRLHALLADLGHHGDVLVVGVRDLWRK